MMKVMALPDHFSAASMNVLHWVGATGEANFHDLDPEHFAKAELDGLVTATTGQWMMTPKGRAVLEGVRVA